jgi:hypothetical protein
MSTLGRCYDLINSFDKKFANKLEKIAVNCNRNIDPPLCSFIQSHKITNQLHTYSVTKNYISIQFSYFFPSVKFPIQVGT